MFEEVSRDSWIETISQRWDKKCGCLEQCQKYQTVCRRQIASEQLQSYKPAHKLFIRDLFSKSLWPYLRILKPIDKGIHDVL